jgi:hypothetical protein
MTFNQPLVSVNTKDTMTTNPQESQPQEKQNDKEFNFRALEKKFEQERQARMEAEERAAAAERATQERERMSKINSSDDDDDDEPYVDKKRFKRGLNQFGEQIKTQTKAEIEQAVQTALEQERRSNYLKDNADFQKVMTPDMIEKFANTHPRLAENILRMPDGFERQKLVYENIKALGIDKPEQKQPGIQEKIDANRKGPYYQPSGVGTAPYANASDFSDQGQKAAFAKMQELKNRLRLG